jgi:hypothetical protein
LLQLTIVDVYLLKKSETGIDTVNGVIGGGKFVIQVIPASGYTLVGIKGNRQLLIVIQEVFNLIQTQPGPVKG